ncbi:MAG TPA: serine/threonine-protein kinase, partial [Polyangiaceae bacterium]
MSLSSDDALTRRAMRRLGESIRGRYSISRLIGIGGMAAVYGGIHRSGFPVAVKILHERLASDPEIERLFRREALLANTVGHDGVVPVTDDDVTEDGCVFLVMPLLVGETLRARAERMGGRLPMEEVVVLAHSLLETLAAAHEKRIVHRDIKPENLFLTTAGELKVLDFGIGRFFQTNEAASVTFSGRALGTPAYMAPEQALGRLREVDARTDLWAVGATMFWLLTGRFVHDADTAAELVVRAATQPARAIATVAPEIPAPVAAIVDRAVAFARDDRWASARAMAAAIEEAHLALHGEALTRAALTPLSSDRNLPTVVTPDAVVGDTLRAGEEMGDTFAAGPTVS